VDFNRTGIPLLEIVSEPDLRSGREAAEYAAELRRLVRYLGIGDGNMQEGSLRCDVNISVREKGSPRFGTKVEIKNMNSFSAIQKAIDHEIERQIETIERGGKIVQETRLWEEAGQRTVSMRAKEGSSDYRYFPEPDIPPLEVPAERLERERGELPELPARKRRRYEREFGLSAYDARVLTDDRAVAEYFEAAVAAGGNPKPVANWISQDIAAHLNEGKLTMGEIALKADGLAELVKLIENGTISGKIAKEILPELLSEGGYPGDLVARKGLVQISDTSAIESLIDEIIAAHPGELEKYRSGKTNLKGFFIGQVMKKSAGKADPKLTDRLLEQKLQG
jgi:aspartyl-tRNA(Asn)/glutamyl-tRNA(Gln) amidotransferase subunit B